MSDKSYLGAGMKFPPQINPATGRIVVSSEEQSVKESIYMILMTNKTERIVRPDFGSRINSYTFMDVNLTTLNILSRELKEMILEQEPRVSEVVVDVTDQSVAGRLIINIDYLISATHQRGSLVFPYYLDNAEEEQAIEDEEFAEYNEFEEEINDGSENID